MKIFLEDYKNDIIIDYNNMIECSLEQFTDIFADFSFEYGSFIGLKNDQNFIIEIFKYGYFFVIDIYTKNQDNSNNYIMFRKILIEIIVKFYNNNLLIMEYYPKFINI